MTEKEENGVPSQASQGNKVAVQLKKMRDANLKYKDLLKLAKDRITQQEDELKRLKAETEQRNKEEKEREVQNPATIKSVDDGDVGGDSAELSCNIVRICQRIEAQDNSVSDNSNSNNGNSSSSNNTSKTTEIWALIEFEVDNPEPDSTLSMTLTPLKRTKKWKRFDSETALQDFIRRDTGEPLTLPPYSLTPQQSASIQEQAKQNVTQITEEFRRFRVKAEMARKQADAQIRELQNSKMRTAQQRIEGHDVEKELEQARSGNSQVERVKAEMAQQEAQWKEAYDIIVAENNMLKSSGSEALLASQWRQRYDTLLKEKDDLGNKLKMERQQTEMVEAGKYEMKYRDLKESFRLYRKKAKEIFEAQNNGNGSAQEGLLKMTNHTTEESKLDYLKNLMVNYLTSDIAVREHMESAIGTVLQFSSDDIAKIEKKKLEDGYWGIF